MFYFFDRETYLSVKEMLKFLAVVFVSEMDPSVNKTLKGNTMDFFLL